MTADGRELGQRARYTGYFTLPTRPSTKEGAIEVTDGCKRHAASGSGTAARCSDYEKVCMSSVERHADYSQHGPITFLCGEGRQRCLLEQVRHSPLSRPMAAFNW